ncbi:MAG: hypothetical protein LBJ00_18370 [Planctomycetaceae bacterium]|jgi:hypothetical protein|nr:hypothetical protein [Planctomycetaceae bacterium]
MTSDSNKNNTDKHPDSFLRIIKMPRRNFIIVAVIGVLVAIPVVSTISRRWYLRKNSYTYKIKGAFSFEKRIGEEQWEGGSDSSNFIPFSAQPYNDGVATTFIASFSIRQSVPPDMTTLYEISVISGGKTVVSDRGTWGVTDPSVPESEGMSLIADWYRNYISGGMTIVSAEVVLPDNVSYAEIDYVIVSVEEYPHYS